MKPLFIYLHGFNSSPDALKAQQVSTFIDDNEIEVTYLRPCISDKPDQAIRQLDALIQSSLNQYQRIILIGSSLGGFYATYLADKYELQAVLVNPAVRPHELMRKYLGWNENPYSQVRYELTATHMQTLQSAYINSLQRPCQFLVLLQMADEVLDATEASARFYQCACRIAPGGDHRFQHFDQLLPDIFHWAGLLKV